MNPYDELSEEAKSILSKKAVAWRWSQKETLEYMIMEYSPTNEVDKAKWYLMRDQARIEFFENKPNPTLNDAWTNGYKRGWAQFQMRKPNHPFLREE